MGTSLIIYYLEKLPGKGTFTTQKKPLKPGSVWEEPLFTRINLAAGSSFSMGFHEAVVTHRRGVKKNRTNEKWIFRGQTEFEEFIIEIQFRCFYKFENNLFVPMGDLDSVKNAISRLNRELPKHIKLLKVHINLSKVFSKISKQDPNVEVNGAWFRRDIEGNIDCEAAFGHKIRHTAAFSEMKKKGKPTNLSLNTTFQNEEINVSISSSGKIYFKTPYPIKTCLNFINLLGPYTSPIKSAKKGNV
jgi:hypothetical protein